MEAPIRRRAQIALAATLMVVSALGAAEGAAADTGGGGMVLPPTLPDDPGGVAPPVWSPSPRGVAQLRSDGRTAVPPSGAPKVVRRAIYAANRITTTRYRWGGGHGSFDSRAYDCSGAVSYALHGAGLLDAPLDSGLFMRWGESGPGAWITVYANRQHAFVVIAGLRFDTSGVGEHGPRWRLEARSTVGFRPRHLPGL
jgi:cell wall-associated NlpC family hydrolase